jgi:polysaccharide biosynthesis/export protein
MITRLLFVLLFCSLSGVPLLTAQTRAMTSPDHAVLSYKITLTDLLRIDIYQEDDLRTMARVDAKGKINLPLVGEVDVAGLTVREAQAAVETSYREGRYLRSPQVTINVEAYAAREVSIQGQVRSPGRYPMPIETSMTVLELVTRAGGFTDTAKGTSVNITRVLRDGTKQVFNIDVDSLLKGKDRANIDDNSLMLEPGDIVFVPERLF